MHNCACNFLTSEPLMQDITSKELRQVFGEYPTGVTIVTTKDSEGNPLGMTANSFASVSLSPPLISWCVDKNGSAHGAFTNSPHFAVHFLSANQQDQSDIFATSAMEERFPQVKWSEGRFGSPIISESLCVLECALDTVYPAGDHSIVLGVVEHVQRREGIDPLLFYRGRYKQF